MREQISVGHTAVQYISKQFGGRVTTKFMPRIYPEPSNYQFFGLWLAQNGVHNRNIAGFRITKLKATCQTEN